MPITDLDKLIESMDPSVQEEKYYFATLNQDQLGALLPYVHLIQDVFREDEGLSIVFLEVLKAEIEGMSPKEIIGPFAMITLNVNSDLLAVGFLAKIAKALADENISVNAFSAYHHDHLFVPFDKADLAVRTLKDIRK